MEHVTRSKEGLYCLTKVSREVEWSYLYMMMMMRERERGDREHEAREYMTCTHSRGLVRE